MRIYGRNPEGGFAPVNITGRQTTLNSLGIWSAILTLDSSVEISVGQSFVSSGNIPALDPFTGLISRSYWDGTFQVTELPSQYTGQKNRVAFNFPPGTPFPGWAEGGRINRPFWVEVSTTPSGQNDYVYITALIQCLKLNINESPFWADWGIPAQQSVIQQVFPDFYVSLIQQRYAPFFARLQITKVQSPIPTYNIEVVTNQGVSLNVSIPQ